MTPCVTYARVSSEEQAKVGYSIPEQTRKMAGFAAQQGLDVQGSFEDVYSARRGRRPGFEAMLAFLREHREVRSVLVHKVDRLSRNWLDWARVTEELGVRVLSVEEPVGDGPIGALTQSVNLGVAKWYALNLAGEVKKGLRAKFLAGGYNGKAPFGYRNIPRTRTEKATVEVDSKTAPIARRVFDQYATGRWSLRGLALDLFDDGLRTSCGKPLSANQVQAMLRNPFYKGVTTFLDEQRPGVHEAIIDAELWARVQTVQERRSLDSGEKGSRCFLLRGLLYCGVCQRRMTAELHHKGAYYRCYPDAEGRRCPARYVPVLLLDSEVEQRLDTISLPATAVASIGSALDQMAVGHEARRSEERHALGTRQTLLQNQLLQVTDGYARGVVPTSAYEPLRDRYQAELDRVKNRLRALDRDIHAEVAAVKSLLVLAGSLRRFYDLAPTEDNKKDLLTRVFHRIVVIDRTVQSIEYQPPFDCLLPADSRLRGSEVPRDAAQELLEAGHSAQAA